MYSLCLLHRIHNFHKTSHFYSCRANYPMSQDTDSRLPPMQLEQYTTFQADCYYTNNVDEYASLRNWTTKESADDTSPRNNYSTRHNRSHMQLLTRINNSRWIKIAFPDSIVANSSPFSHPLSRRGWVLPLMTRSRRGDTL